ncbi:MAG TPA: hypothetical protein VNX67_08040 [Solirubrobacteraceae bacterium]|jgi:hypothetical protein|nr:hypothetical protein [Solirubrobacteraceae bacterium]
MPVRLFTFVQMELPWELGPADGRYLLRKPAGLEGDQPEHVVVLSTVGAERRGLLGGRSRARRTDAEPARVPVARATIVDPVPLSLDTQARKWLEQLDPEREAHAAANVLNRVLWAHRIAGAAAHIHEVSATQALVVRAGYGEGEQVADGLWSDARELVLSRKRAGRRATVLRPQERLAVLLSNRGEALLCEELVLRARLDLDAGRLALAAIELERAYAAALAELPAEQRDDMRERIEELAQLRGEVERAAHAVLPAGAMAPGAAAETTTPPAHASRARASTPTEPDEQVVRHALERLEAALRARTALGFSVR